MKKQKIKILVPIDFKEDSINGLMTAVDIAKKTGGEIGLFHIKSDLQHMINQGYSGFEENSGAFRIGQKELEEENDKTKMELESLAQNYGSDNIKLTTFVGTGRYKEELEKYLSKNKVDLIVMGTSGKNSLAELFTGNKAEQSIKLSNIPVLAVKKYNRANKLKKLLLGVNLEEYDPEIIKSLKQIPEYMKMEVYIVYVKHSQFEKSDEIMQYLEKFTKKHNFKNYKLDVLAEGDIQKKLEEFAVKNDIDVIATITRGERGLFRLIYSAHTDSLLEETNKSVLSIKD